MEKEHFEILLEHIENKMQLVLEGHVALDRKFDSRFEELNEKIEHNSFLIGVLNKKIDDVDAKLGQKIDDVDAKLSNKIDAVAADLSAHRVDTEAHYGIYRVKEG